MTLLGPILLMAIHFPHIFGWSQASLQTFVVMNFDLLRQYVEIHGEQKVVVLSLCFLTPVNDTKRSETAEL